MARGRSACTYLLCFLFSVVVAASRFSPFFFRKLSFSCSERSDGDFFSWPGSSVAPADLRFPRLLDSAAGSWLPSSFSVLTARRSFWNCLAADFLRLPIRSPRDVCDALRALLLTKLLLKKNKFIRCHNRTRKWQIHTFYIQGNDM